MLLKLRQIFDREGDKKDIYLDIPNDELGELSGVGTFLTPISLRGDIKNRAGIVETDCVLSVTLRRICDRCLNEFNREYNIPVKHTLIRGADGADGFEPAVLDDNEYIVCDNDTLDVNELAIQDLLLSLPTKTLCREDCKGLCPVCGQDLNLGGCDCNV